MENKLPKAIDLAATNAGHCVERAEFFTAKSRAAYAAQAAKNWQAGAENWAMVEELLRELAQYRNYAHKQSGITEEVARGMRLQGYDY